MQGRLAQLSRASSSGLISAVLPPATLAALAAAAPTSSVASSQAAEYEDESEIEERERLLLAVTAVDRQAERWRGLASEVRSSTVDSRNDAAIAHRGLWSRAALLVCCSGLSLRFRSVRHACITAPRCLLRARRHSPQTEHVRYLLQQYSDSQSHCLLLSTYHDC